MCSQDLDLSLLFLVFNLIFTVVSRLILLYSTVDKTSRLKMKSFSTLRDTQRGSQSYTEKRRRRKETEVTRRRKGGIKRRETDLGKCSVLCVLHSPEQPQRFTELGREKKGEGGDRGHLVEKKESQNGERAIKPIITLLRKNGY